MGCRVVVNADDLGVSKGATLGIIKAHREGIVTSASLATTTQDYEHAVESCVKTNPELGIGLHFTLTSGKPVSPIHKVPLLVDDRGFFRWRFVSLLRATTLHRPRGLLEQIEMELEAQLQRLESDGIHPDHINGERHIHLIPALLKLIVAAANRHAIPFVRLGRDIGSRYITAADVSGLALNGGFVKSCLLSSLSALDRRDAHKIFSTDYVASYLYTGRLDLLLPRLLKRAPVNGSLEIMVHPGLPEDSRNLDLGNAELARYLTSDDRRAELDACLSARDVVDKVTLTTFGKLAQERTKAI